MTWVYIVESPILNSGKITRIAYIDDVFAFHNEADLEQVIGWVSKALEQSVKQTLELIPLTYPVPDDDIWRTQLREIWDQSNHEEKTKVINGLSKILNSQLSKDKMVATQLKQLLPEKIDYQELSPSNWIRKKAQILTNITQDSRLLCLFDQDLSAETNFSAQGANSGGGLLKDLLDSTTDSSHIICGILSHTIASMETEHEYQKNFTREYQIGELAPKKFLPLANLRLHYYESFFNNRITGI